MSFEMLLRSMLPLPAGDLHDYVPAEHVSRQTWQEAIEQLVETVRGEFDRPLFGLSVAEVSVYYHRKLPDFVELLQMRSS